MWYTKILECCSVLFSRPTAKYYFISCSASERKKNKGGKGFKESRRHSRTGAVMSTEDIVSKAVAEAKEKAAALTEKAEDGKSSDAKNGGEDKAGQKEGGDNSAESTTGKKRSRFGGSVADSAALEATKPTSTVTFPPAMLLRLPSRSTARNRVNRLNFCKSESPST